MIACLFICLCVVAAVDVMNVVVGVLVLFLVVVYVVVIFCCDKLLEQQQHEFPSSWSQPQLLEPRVAQQSL